MEWSVGKTTNTKYYRHVFAALGNTDVPAMLPIRYTKGVRLGMETRCLGQSIYGYAQVFMAIP